jgi:hypothetical protein
LAQLHGESVSICARIDELGLQLRQDAGEPPVKIFTQNAELGIAFGIHAGFAKLPRWW